jgi:isoaspartyl peptidase/L-asparaginase-like protein (Ntn-hydrolase superfamily)
MEKHIVEAERSADTFAVNQGMEEYILKTKNFILNHADIDENYKKRIKRYYLSPEEIMQIVQER